MAMKMGHSYPKEWGFTGSSGASPVKGYMRGGSVKESRKEMKAPSRPVSQKGEFKSGGMMKGALSAGMKSGMKAPMKKYKLGGVVTASEYKVPVTASPIYKYAKGGAVKKMSGYPKVAAKYSVPPTNFKKYAKGGKIESPVGKIAKANDSNEKWEDYKKGGMKKARGGRC